MESISMDTLLAKLGAAREAMRESPLLLKPTEKNVDFSKLMTTSLQKVDNDQTAANKMAEQFQLGDPKVTLEDTMIAMQKANVTFQAAVQVRNRLVSAYHDIMNLQI